MPERYAPATRTAIDAAGRIVVPKQGRDAMRLTAGRAIDLVYTDGRIEMDFMPVDVTMDADEGLPRLVLTQQMENLTDGQVRDVLEATRR